MNRRNIHIDLITLLLFVMLSIFGWMTVYAVSNSGELEQSFEFNSIYGKQLIWMGVSMLAGLIILMLDARFFEAISYLAYGVGIALLLMVIFVGKTVNGAQSWLVIAGQPFQPSEFAKVATALALARYMSKLNFSLSNPLQLLVALGIVLLPALIVLLQNDTGSALVFGSLLIVFFREGLHPLIPFGLVLIVAIAILTLALESAIMVTAGIVLLALLAYAVSFSRRYWARNLIYTGAVIFLLGGFSFSMDALVNRLPQHQQTRIKVLFNPNIDPQGAGYNVIHSKIAIGSGGINGKGFRAGNYTKYRFVPKQETDFIYCTIGEEQGWLGTSATLVLFFLLIWRVKFLAENSKTRFARIYGYGVLSILFFHVLVNVGMTIGLMPVIGIPLPFFSYGGSSLLSFSILIFILVNFYSHRASVLGTKL